MPHMMSISALTLANISLINSSCAFVWDTLGIVPIELASANRMQNVATFAYIDAIITRDCGVMKFRMVGKKELVACYFELKDTNSFSEFLKISLLVCYVI